MALLMRRVGDIGTVGVVREFQRGAVRLHILHHAARQEIHGAWLTEELARRGYRISPGTLYPTLHRLESEGLLTSVQRVIEGRTRRMYKATEAGREALAADRKALEELAREILGSSSSANAVHDGADREHRGAADHRRDRKRQGEHQASDHPDAGDSPSPQCPS
ncbi:MAG: PadR family transcriptional regulator [Mycobacterium sp.]|jgi:DNA-binding PadR family transcriptional regulator|nr:PadR family transcriptional regulator [Mycobacterium sp.]